MHSPAQTLLKLKRENYVLAPAVLSPHVSSVVRNVVIR